MNIKINLGPNLLIRPVGLSHLKVLPQFSCNCLIYIISNLKYAQRCHIELTTGRYCFEALILDIEMIAKVSMGQKQPDHSTGLAFKGFSANRVSPQIKKSA